MASDQLTNWKRMETPTCPCALRASQGFVLIVALPTLRPLGLLHYVNKQTTLAASRLKNTKAKRRRVISALLECCPCDCTPMRPLRTKKNWPRAQSHKCVRGVRFVVRSHTAVPRDPGRGDRGAPSEREALAAASAGRVPRAVGPEVAPRHAAACAARAHGQALLELDKRQTLGLAVRGWRLVLAVRG